MNSVTEIKERGWYVGNRDRMKTVGHMTTARID
jgi:hypothetical protein